MKKEKLVVPAAAGISQQEVDMRTILTKPVFHMGSGIVTVPGNAFVASNIVFLERHDDRYPNMVTDWSMEHFFKLPDYIREEVIRSKTFYANLKDRCLLQWVISKATVVSGFEKGAIPGWVIKEIAHKMEAEGRVLFPAKGIKMDASSSRMTLMFLLKKDFNDFFARLGLSEAVVKILRRNPDKFASLVTKLLSTVRLLDGIKGIEVIPDDPLHDGMGFANPEFFKLNSLEIGCKLSGTVKFKLYPDDSVPMGTIRMHDKENTKRWDLVHESLRLLIWEDAANRPSIKASHLKAPGLMTQMFDSGWAKTWEGRKPSFAFDVQLMLGVIPNVNLAREGRFLRGEAFEESVFLSMFGYVSKKTNSIGLNAEGTKFLLNPNWRDEVVRMMYLKHCLKRLKGVIGNAECRDMASLDLAPADAETKWVIGIIYPIDVPVVMQIKLANNLAYVDARLVVEILHKDYDGDQLIFIKLEEDEDGSYIAPFNIDHLPVFPRDIERLKKYFKMPEKAKDGIHNDTRRFIDVYAAAVDNAVLLGMVDLMMMRLIECLMMADWSKEEILNALMYVFSGKVQIFIDSLKYAVGKVSVPKVDELAMFIDASGLFTKKAFDAVNEHLTYVCEFFNAYRSKKASLTEVCRVAAKAKAETKCFSEMVVRGLRPLITGAEEYWDYVNNEEPNCSLYEQLAEIMVKSINNPSTKEPVVEPVKKTRKPRKTVKKTVKKSRKVSK